MLEELTLLELESQAAPMLERDPLAIAGDEDHAPARLAVSGEAK